MEFQIKPDSLSFVIFLSSYVIMENVTFPLFYVFVSTVVVRTIITPQYDARCTYQVTHFQLLITSKVSYKHKKYVLFGF